MSNDAHEFEVVWNGTMSRNGEGLQLVPDRDTRADHYDTPARIYNKTGKHTKAEKAKRKSNGPSGNHSGQPSPSEQP